MFSTEIPFLRTLKKISPHISMIYRRFVFVYVMLGGGLELNKSHSSTLYKNNEMHFA